MPWNNPNSYPFNQQGVMQAPARSGVYALYTSQQWIYVGESNDIQRRLLEHLRGDNPCITRSRPTSFSYELCDENQRVARQNQLIVELRPTCNQMLG